MLKYIGKSSLLLMMLLLGCESNNISIPPTPTIPAPIPQRKLQMKVCVYCFSAPWCPPCRVFGPTFEKWKEKYGNEHISFQKVNTDEDGDLATKFKVSALPTVIVTHDGVEVKRFVGAPTESQIQEFLK